MSSFDKDDEELDDILQGMPRPLERRASAPLPLRRPATVDTPTIPFTERARRVEPADKRRHELQGLTDVTALGWYTERTRRRVRESFQYLVTRHVPCRVCPPASPNYTAMWQRANPATRNKIDNGQQVIVQFLGVNVASKGHLAIISHKDFLPYHHHHHADDDNNNNAATVDENAWSPSILEMYRKYLFKSRNDAALKRKPAFWNRAYRQRYPDEVAAWFDYWFRIEVYYLHNVLTQIREQQQQQQQQQQNDAAQGAPAAIALADKSQQPHVSETYGEDVVSPSNEPTKEAPTPPPALNKTDNDEETTPFVKKLRAGDEIEYYPTAFVASRRNARVARIFCVHGKTQRETCLELDNRQFVEVSGLVSLRQRYLRGKLVPVDEPKTMAVDCFKLETITNGRVDFLRSAMPKLLSAELVQQAWDASADCIEKGKSAAPVDATTEQVKAASSPSAPDSGTADLPVSSPKKSTTDTKSEVASPHPLENERREVTDFGRSPDTEAAATPPPPTVPSLVRPKVDGRKSRKSAPPQPQSDDTLPDTTPQCTAPCRKGRKSAKTNARAKRSCKNRDNKPLLPETRRSQRPRMSRDILTYP